MTTYTTEKKVCSRCKGKGILSGHVVVYAGAPGGCYKCAGAGEVYKDTFYQAFGVGRKFYGVTRVVKYRGDNPNNGTFKLIATDWNPANNISDSAHTYSAVEITEEQARSFWERYKDRATLGGVRVQDI